ncbi:hypothetical protein JB92DRAFT_1675241 [Gautieria morchelliformis]|nr:hypothetical protein JB92DRAFT_1675241 [Gautieria morchelliformis]
MVASAHTRTRAGSHHLPLHNSISTRHIRRTCTRTRIPPPPRRSESPIQLPPLRFDQRPAGAGTGPFHDARPLPPPPPLPDLSLSFRRSGSPHEHHDRHQRPSRASSRRPRCRRPSSRPRTVVRRLRGTQRGIWIGIYRSRSRCSLRRSGSPRVLVLVLVRRRCTRHPPRGGPHTYMRDSARIRTRHARCRCLRIMAWTRAPPLPLLLCATQAGPRPCLCRCNSTRTRTPSRARARARARHRHRHRRRACPSAASTPCAPSSSRA